VGSSGIRVLYVPNEHGQGRQAGIRRAFADLLNAGLVDEVSVFSLLWRIRAGGNAEGHRQDLIGRVKEFQPSIVLMQHLGGTGLERRHFQAIRRIADFALIYHEGDPYTRFVHPLPKEARLAGRFSDVVYTVGAGTFARNFLASGAANVRWEPSTFDPGRFGRIPVDSIPHRDHDVVMIANRNTPRLRGLPNWRDRIRFVEYMQDRFKDRFVIFGRGWTGPGALGPIDYSKQGDAIRSGWVTANWDHFADEPNYFSDRLPTSLAEGSVHATGFHPGFDQIFGNETRQFLKSAPTHQALGDLIEEFLADTTPERRIEAGRHAQAFAQRRFRQDDQLVRLLNFDRVRIAPSAASDAWRLDSTGLEDL